MKKKILVLVLALACMTMLTGCFCQHEWAEANCTTPKTCTKCEKTEGEALGHDIVEASCTEAKHCTRCADMTEGEPLGHNWQEATTEAPQTCATCGQTEGERIITDPRFTTAATAAIQGKWAASLYLNGEMMELSGFQGELECKYILNFGNDGALSVDFELGDAEAFMDSLVEYSLQEAYNQLAAQGIGREDADAAIQQATGMTMEEYARASFEGLNFEEMFSSILSSLGGVYYVEGDQLYTGSSWETIVLPSTFSIEGDTLYLESDEDTNEVLGWENGLTRVTE